MNLYFSAMIYFIICSVSDIKIDFNDEEIDLPMVQHKRAKRNTVQLS